MTDPFWVNQRINWNKLNVGVFVVVKLNMHTNDRATNSVIFLCFCFHKVALCNPSHAITRAIHEQRWMTGTINTSHLLKDILKMPSAIELSASNIQFAFRFVWDPLHLQTTLMMHLSQFIYIIFGATQSCFCHRRHFHFHFKLYDSFLCENGAKNQVNLLHFTHFATYLHYIVPFTNYVNWGLLGLFVCVRVFYSSFNHRLIELSWMEWNGIEF